MRRQHGVITRRQLRQLGFSDHAIDHRIARGRLRRIHRGVLLLGNRPLGRLERWMAAVLACGPDALLSHRSAAELWELLPARGGAVEISVTGTSRRRIAGIRVHRRNGLTPLDCGFRRDIPVTTPTRTLADIAPNVSARQLEAAVNAADKLDLVDPERLRNELAEMSGQAGVQALLRLLDRHVFRLTDSELERRFLALVRSVGLSRPATRQVVNGYRVDFHWADLGLVVETDGLRYHRTPSEQARDRQRDQTHSAAGLTTLRFTHAQVRFEPGEVIDVLARVIGRLAARRTAA